MKPVFVFLMLCLALPAQAFILIKGTTYNKGARPVANAPIWPSRSVDFYVNTNQSAYGGSLSPAVSSGEFKAAVQQALTVWTGACQADIHVHYVDTTSNTKSSSDGMNTISWENRTTGGGNMYADTTLLASAFTSLSGDTMVDCDIVVNGEFSGTFGVNAEPSKHDLVSTIAHEIGHCLGLDHPVEPSGAPAYTSTSTILNEATMVQSVIAGAGTIWRRTVNRDDVDGVTCIYQKERDFRRGDGCTSYHGTNGGANISGVVTGGPSISDVPSCGTEADAVSAVSKSIRGGGCINQAFAEGRHAHRPSSPFESGWLFEILELFFCWCICKVALRLKIRS